MKTETGKAPNGRLPPLDPKMCGAEVIATIKQKYQLRQPKAAKVDPTKRKKVATMDPTLNSVEVLASIRKKYRLRPLPIGERSQPMLILLYVPVACPVDSTLTRLHDACPWIRSNCARGIQGLPRIRTSDRNRV